MSGRDCPPWHPSQGAPRPRPLPRDLPPAPADEQPVDDLVALAHAVGVLTDHTT